MSSSLTPEVGKFYVLRRLKYASNASIIFNVSIIFARCESFTSSGNPRMRMFQTSFKMDEEVRDGCTISYTVSIEKDEDGEYVTMTEEDDCRTKIHHSIIARHCKDGDQKIWVVPLNPRYYIHEEYDPNTTLTFTTYK